MTMILHFYNLTRCVVMISNFFILDFSCSMASTLPALIIPVEVQTSATFILTFGCMVVIMIVSQFCWTKMALLTPPGEIIFVDNSTKVDRLTMRNHQLIQNNEDEDAP